MRKIAPLPYAAVCRMVEAPDDYADVCTTNAALFGHEKVSRGYEAECETARFIARACNSHKELVSLLREAAEYMQCFKRMGALEEQDVDLLARIRAAIKEATRKP